MLEMIQAYFTKAAINSDEYVVQFQLFTDSVDVIVAPRLVSVCWKLGDLLNRNERPEGYSEEEIAEIFNGALRQFIQLFAGPELSKRADSKAYERLVVNTHKLILASSDATDMAWLFATLSHSHIKQIRWLTAIYCGGLDRIVNTKTYRGNSGFDKLSLYVFKNRKQLSAELERYWGFRKTHDRSDIGANKQQHVIIALAVMLFGYKTVDPLDTYILGSLMPMLRTTTTAIELDPLDVHIEWANDNPLCRFIFSPDFTSCFLIEDLIVTCEQTQNKNYIPPLINPDTRRSLTIAQLGDIQYLLGCMSDKSLENRYDALVKGRAALAENPKQRLSEKTFWALKVFAGEAKDTRMQECYDEDVSGDVLAPIYQAGDRFMQYVASLSDSEYVRLQEITMPCGALFGAFYENIFGVHGEKGGSFCMNLAIENQINPMLSEYDRYDVHCSKGPGLNLNVMKAELMDLLDALIAGSIYANTLFSKSNVILEMTRAVTAKCVSDGEAVYRTEAIARMYARDYDDVRPGAEHPSLLRFCKVFEKQARIQDLLRYSQVNVQDEKKLTISEFMDGFEASEKTFRKISASIAASPEQVTSVCASV
ncbi:MAG: hypothetical protein COB66_01940 [Coxiella sp. (in: Bacteria)]|nr:MAG: hypothetical protein COB66_01940 [Coxiella sp. (in: g-proteobacteria)]